MPAIKPHNGYIIRRPFALMMLLLTTACVSGYPLGMSEQQWTSMSPAQQQEALAEQAHRDELLRQQQAAAMQEVPITPVGRVYYESVDCELSGGKAKFAHGLSSGDWREIAPIRFSVARGTAIDLPILRLDKSG